MSVDKASVVVNRTTRKFYADYVVTDVYSQKVVSQVQILSGQVGV